MQFTGYADRIGDLREILIQSLGESFKEKLDNKQLRMDQANKSAVVRTSNPDWKIPFTIPFSEVYTMINDILDIVQQFTNYAEQLNYSDLY